MTGEWRHLLLLAALVLAALASPVPARAAETVTLAYIGREADPAYAPTKAYTGLVLRDRKRPLDGARLGLRDSKIMGRALGLKFKLMERMLASGADAVAAIRGIAETQDANIFLLDLPIEDMPGTLRALQADPLILFNVRHGDDSLRGADCAANLFHTMPSDAMAMDGLAQFLKQKHWERLLVLQGEEAEDARLAAAFQISAKKFGLDIEEVRLFKLGNDPRERGRNNIRLLTSLASYDAVFLADAVGEFGRYVPYQTLLPRPVVGTEGLIADAWHWTFERYGAPQLNRRFEKQAGYRMTAPQWAAWAAVRAVVEAILRTGKTDAASLRSYLVSNRVNLDLYKGAPGGFRPWNNQLRQAILLHTANAVIARAPIEGFLHQTNNLDTLGAGPLESACRFRSAPPDKPEGKLP